MNNKLRRLETTITCTIFFIFFIFFISFFDVVKPFVQFNRLDESNGINERQARPRVRAC